MESYQTPMNISVKQYTPRTFKLVHKPVIDEDELLLCELCDTAQGADPGSIMQEGRFHPPLRAVHGARQDNIQSAEHLWQRGSPCGKSHQSLCCCLSLLPLPIITVWLTGCKTSNYLLITVAMCLFVLCVVDRTIKFNTLLACTEYISGGICLTVHLCQLYISAR